MLARMPASYLSPKAGPRHADSIARGVVALEPIATGDVVAAFGGRCVGRGELEDLPTVLQHLAVQIDEDLYMLDTEAEAAGAGDDAAAGSADAVHVGHSCRPNCGMRGAVLVVAMRDVAPGELLTFDRAMIDGSDVHETECNCGEFACRGKITGHDWMQPELQLAYRGYFSPYLARRISSLVSVGAERRAFAL